MRCLVTGAAGFVGGYLLQELVGAGHDVVATYHRTRPTDASAADDGRAVQWQALDLLQPQQVVRLIESQSFDAVVHLGAMSFVPDVEKHRATAFAINASGTLHLLEALRTSSSSTRLVCISSGHVYAPVEGALTEQSRLGPASFYGQTKLAAEQVAAFYRTEGLAVSIVRAFNHIGPGQATHFSIASFAQQIAEIDMGLRAPLLAVGNLAVERDFTDVRDVVRAYRMLAEGDAEADIYNVASGRAVPLQSILDQLRSFAAAEIEVQLDPRRLRGSEQRSVYGDATKLREACGWEPAIALETTLREIYEAACLSARAAS